MACAAAASFYFGKLGFFFHFFHRNQKKKGKRNNRKKNNPISFASTDISEHATLHQSKAIDRHLTAVLVTGFLPGFSLTKKKRWWTSLLFSAAAGYKSRAGRLAATVICLQLIITELCRRHYSRRPAAIDLFLQTKEKKKKKTKERMHRQVTGTALPLH